MAKETVHVDVCSRRVRKVNQWYASTTDVTAEFEE
jgi:hypothetical protein